jgi:hypothetical protein
MLTNGAGTGSMVSGGETGGEPIGLLDTTAELDPIGASDISIDAFRAEETAMPEMAMPILSGSINNSISTGAYLDTSAGAISSVPSRNPTLR